MKKITREVTPKDLAYLLQSARTATVAWNDAGEVAAAPAAFRLTAGKYLIGLPPGTLRPGQEVAAVIDEGPMYFDLRGVRVRGTITRSTDPPPGNSLEWLEIEPAREVAWHYGALRAR